MTHAARRSTVLHVPSWTPDPRLPEVALSGRLRMADLAAPDQAWVVASLRLRGESVNMIAERLGCSERRVQQVQAEPLGVVVRLLLEAQASAEAARRTRDGRVRERELLRECDRLRSSRSVLIDQLAVMRSRLDAVGV